MIAPYLTQAGYDIRCEWGERGLAALATVCNAIVIVDVLSFTTCVTIAASRGATVIPWRDDVEAASAFASAMGATVCGPRSSTQVSLSPRSWQSVEDGQRFILCSPNGASLSLHGGPVRTVAGSLLNASAVAEHLSAVTPPIGIIPAGERWGDGSLRPAIEDYLGAGAVIRMLSGRKSPEATAAENAFESAKANLNQVIEESVSGLELTAMGFADDIPVACQLDTLDAVPVIVDGAYVRSSSYVGSGRHTDDEVKVR